MGKPTGPAGSPMPIPLKAKAPADYGLESAHEPYGGGFQKYPRRPYGGVPYGGAKKIGGGLKNRLDYRDAASGRLGRLGGKRGFGGGKGRFGGGGYGYRNAGGYGNGRGQFGRKPWNAGYGNVGGYSGMIKKG